jgi:AraC family transcriptional regulator
MAAQVKQMKNGTVVHQIAGHALMPAITVEPAPISTVNIFGRIDGFSVNHITITNSGTSTKPQPKRGGLAPWQERRVSEMMESSLEEPPTLRKLAQSCSLSASHFAKAFKQSFGHAPHQWLMHRRVARAHELMRNTLEPLAEIALACGFSDQSHFSRVFSRLTGLTPGVWRRRNRGVTPQFA